MQALLSSLGYKRGHSGYVYLGDLQPGSSLATFGGYVTSASYANTGGVARVTLNHPAISFNYVVLANMYSNRADTNDNDGNPHLIWIYPVSTTQTQILYEYGSESGT